MFRNSRPNYESVLYFTDPASPFMRAIVDLHDYVFMFLVGILVFVCTILYAILRNNRVLFYRGRRNIYAERLHVSEVRKYHMGNLDVDKGIVHLLYREVIGRFVSKLIVVYYDFIIGPRLFYFYYLFTSAQGDRRVMGLERFLLNPLVYIRQVAQNEASVRDTHMEESLGFLSGLCVFAYSILSFPWFFVLRYGSSKTLYYLFYQLRLTNSPVFEQNISFKYAFNRAYARQLRLSTIEAYRFTHNDVLETLWTILPSVILVFIAIPSLLVLFALDEIGKPVITVKAIGHQWYWSYEVTSTVGQGDVPATYAFDSYMVSAADLKKGDHRNLEVDNTLALPVNSHIRLLVTSMDVIHSWAVPALGVKIDAVPGRLNQVGLFIDRHGSFYGQCSEICGTNHAFMPICVEGYSNFQDWAVLFNSRVAS